MERKIFKFPNEKSSRGPFQNRVRKEEVKGEGVDKVPPEGNISNYFVYFSSIICVDLVLLFARCRVLSLVEYCQPLYICKHSTVCTSSLTHSLTYSLSQLNSSLTHFISQPTHFYSLRFFITHKFTHSIYHSLNYFITN